MKSYLVKTLFVGLLLAGSAAGLRAQSYAVDWSTIDGGGGTSTGGVYSVSGTIGQPDAGATMSGGNYAVDGGFWSIMAVVPTPGAPLLTITPAGVNAVVSWPAPATGYALQFNSNLATTNWLNYSGGISNNNGAVISVTLPAQPGNTYFRLKK